MSDKNDVFARFRQELNTRGTEEPTLPTTAPALYKTSKTSKTSKPEKLTVVSRKLPKASLLNQKMLGREQSEQDYTEAIIDIYASFGVPVSASLVHQGPRLCQYALTPGYLEKKSGGQIVKRRVKVNALTRLEKDLALGLATSLRITEVTNKPYLGVEIPRSYPQLVTLYSVLSSPEFAKVEMAGGLGLALGKTVTGQPLVADLTDGPHYLIAGATGGGKSVCIHSVLCSLLMTHGPDSLRLLLIDPKQVELVMYANLPHLVRPVITDVEEAITALSWAVNEMERRLTLMAEVKQRDIKRYNDWARDVGKETLPYIVLVIDELADLMMQNKDEVELLISRLAQKARATGIHLILATQRPSVNVVTGLIKANVPVRISFQVASGIDSRVILDATGAEGLLGEGDCLVRLSGVELIRAQGCFVSDAELAAITNHWLLHGSTVPRRPARLREVVEGEVVEGSFRRVLPEDELLRKAIKLAEQERKVGLMFLQRRLRITYTKAAELIEQMKKLDLLS